MPTKLKPQGGHAPFDFSEAWTEIRTALQSRDQEVLSSIGYEREYGALATLKGHQHLSGENAEDLLDELAGVLTKAGAIAVEVGTPSWNQLIVNLRAIETAPEKLLENPTSIDPATLFTVALNYRRENETPGTHWYDVTEHSTLAPSIEGIASAVRAALTQVATDTRKARAKPPRHDIRYLAEELAAVFRRFQDGQIRRRVSNISIDGNAGGEEYGLFLKFAEIVLPPLETVVRRYKASYRIGRQGLSKAVYELQKQAPHLRNARSSDRGCE